MLLAAVSKAGYVPSVSTLYTHMNGEVPRLRPLFGDSVWEVLISNIENMIIRVSKAGAFLSVSWHVCMDEVAVESRLSYHAKTNQVGYCL
jgi:hypothetical protein